MVKPERIRALTSHPLSPGPVLYWMSREQRVEDNWALLAARELAQRLHQPLMAVFCLTGDFLGATLRQYDFMLQGLRETEKKLRALKIPFYVLTGQPGTELPRFAAAHGLGALVCDFSPLRLAREWKAQVARALSIAVYEVDARNIVPVWQVSGKQEYGAYTLRPKLNRLLREYLEPFPRLEAQELEAGALPAAIDWDAALRGLRLDNGVSPVAGITPGTAAARKILEAFLGNRLREYARERNDPSKSAQSGLSPYLHFGQLAAHRAALEAQRAIEDFAAQEAWLEELIVRRELADNFCCYNPAYDSFAGFPAWARETLEQHRGDPREYRYSLEEFENALTHDPLWNAAQLQMVKTGKMHGYMRMYWAKKILEWSSGPEAALASAIYLNDRYQLDGRDPNGYAGIAWSIGGVHDRPWFPRAVFGKIRYMSYKGARNKFEVDKYITRIKTCDTAGGIA